MIRILSLLIFLQLTICIGYAGNIRPTIFNSYLKISDRETVVDMLSVVMSDEQEPYKARLSVFESVDGLSFYNDHFDRLYPLLDKLLQQAKQAADKEGMFYCYNTIADLYITSWNKEKGLFYLDSAGMYAEQAKNPLNRAAYYRMRGQYIQRYIPHHTPEAIDYMHKALLIYEQDENRGRNKDAIMIVLRNLTFEALQREDSISIFHNYERMEELSKTYQSSIAEFSMMNIKTAINGLHYKYSHREAHLDSMVHYARESLARNQNGLTAGYFNPYLVDIYITAVNALSKKANPNLRLVDSLLSEIENRYGYDTLALAGVCQIKAQMLLDAGKVDAAESMALRAEKYFKSANRNSYYPLFQDNIGLLRDIYFRGKDYKKMLQYDNLWVKAEDEMKSNKMKELELQYKLDEREQEYQSLYKDKQSYQYFYVTFMFLCLALAIFTLVGFLYTNSKKKKFKQEMAIAAAKKREIELKIQLKEEQTVNIQLEKYELLSDFYLKELELAGKSKELETLAQEKEYLDQQIELYRQKIESLEAVVGEAFHGEYDIDNVIVDDIKRRIAQLPDNGRFFANLKCLNKAFIEMLRSKSKGNLSFANLRYCVCFAVGMGVNDVMNIFDLEQFSVYMIRARLKKKFGIGNDRELSTFLRKLLEKTTKA